MQMMFFRRRLVRVHLIDHNDSFEGVLVGIDNHHYRLANGKQIQSPDRSFDLKDVESWIPKQRVLYVQVIG